eukprot:612306-Prorocentrum_minimum.AAC.3
MDNMMLTTKENMQEFNDMVFIPMSDAVEDAVQDAGEFLTNTGEFLTSTAESILTTSLDTAALEKAAGGFIDNMLASIDANRLDDVNVRARPNNSTLLVMVDDLLNEVAEEVVEGPAVGNNGAVTALAIGTLLGGAEAASAGTAPTGDMAAACKQVPPKHNLYPYLTNLHFWGVECILAVIGTGGFLKRSHII